MKIMYSSNPSKQKTGLGRHAREFLSALFLTGEFEIVEYVSQTNFSDSRCKAYPWPCYGSIPDDPMVVKSFLAQAKSEEERQVRHKAVLNGLLVIDEVIEKERPDVIIFCEDIWKIDLFMQKPWWGKIPCIVWTPIDSLPIIDTFIEQKDKLENLWVKAPFAVRALKDKGINSILMPGLINEKSFFKIDESIRNLIRNNSNFKPTDKIIGFNFRNQSRKLVSPLLESLRKYKDKTGDENVKLLLHTNFDEPRQWNIPKLINEYGLHQDVYCTYVCRECRAISIENYKGQNRDCVVCGAEKSVSNPVPEMGVTEEELNCIYGIMDGYCHLANSGGFEFPILEAIYAEIPVATIGYSYGETFTENINIYPIDYILDRDIRSGFMKAHPIVDSVNGFFDFIKKLDVNQFAEKTKETREYFLDRYSCSHTIDLAILELKKLKGKADYSSLFKNLEKNIDYPFNDIYNSEEFLKDLYRNVFNVEPVVSGDEFQSILNQIKSGTTHKKVYDDFIQSAKEFNDSLGKTKLEKMLIENGKKRIIYIMPESLGDCFISLSVIESILNTYNPQEWDVYVATNPRNFEIFEHLNIAKMLPYERWMDNYKQLEGAGDYKGLFDIAFHPYFLTQRAISYHHNGIDIDQLQKYE